ncbi:gamma-glutamyltranspeptidase [Klebsiella pneumoniae]|uniref:Gamma-glutamyltranspeptidase n=1 Tax=Klebsiella pneumoniae TaxID=573 RepID=A0A2X3H029_KLEPN|nr:gamma-glutamyltranspeptidase [Klebsiella pneumoniae]
MVYGSMGGDGQPQTQAALFTRYILQGVPLQESISRPRWAAGPHLGPVLRLTEAGGTLCPACIARLRELGHDVEVLADFSEAMGHAGPLSAIPTVCLKGRPIHAATAPAAGY